MHRFVLIATAAAALLLHVTSASSDRADPEAAAPLSQSSKAAYVEDEDEKVLCYLDGRLCPNGEGFGRNPENNCEFPACPEFTGTCIEDTLDCGNGVVLERDPKDNCFFPECPRDDRMTVVLVCSFEPPYGRQQTKLQSTWQRHAVCDVQYCYRK